MLSDFGDLFGSARTIAGSSGGNSVRGLTFGGATAASTVNIICYVTIATTGNGQDFGDMSGAKYDISALSNSVRGVVGGQDGRSDVIDFFTLSTSGNAQDFGDRTVSVYYPAVSFNTTRAIWAGGNGAVNTIDFVTTATTGNAQDFGNLQLGRAQFGCCFLACCRGRGLGLGWQCPLLLSHAPLRLVLSPPPQILLVGKSRRFHDQFSLNKVMNVSFLCFFANISH